MENCYFFAWHAFSPLPSHNLLSPPSDIIIQGVLLRADQFVMFGRLRIFMTMALTIIFKYFRVRIRCLKIVIRRIKSDLNILF